jgi:predicted outer membrane repeat protein
VADGGAIYSGGYFGVGAVTIRNSTFSGNSAGNHGGAIRSGAFFSPGTLTVVNSTFSGNSAHDGGGIYSDGGDTAQLLNTLVAGNTAAGQSPDVFSTANSFGGHPVASLGHNLIGVRDGSSSSVWVASDLTGTAAAPLNPGLGPLADNGGPTRTMALLPGSPAIAAADPSGAPPTDQRGVARGPAPSIGAYEYAAQAAADHLLFLQQPTDTVAGQTISPAVMVAVVDAFGNVVTGDNSDTVTLALGSNPGGATLQGTPTQTVVNGVATFTDLSLTQAAGGYTLVASSTGLTGATSAGFAVNPAAADHLVFLQQPSDTAAGQTISPVVVAVVDVFGNVVTGDNSDTVTLSPGTNPGGGTLSGTLTVTVVNGVATFGDLSIDQSGVGYTLHATIGGGLPDIDSDPFTITM